MRRFLRILICTILVCACAGCVSKRVLLVSQYDDNNPYTGEVSDIVQKAIASENVLPIFTIYNMNTIKRPTQIWRDEMGHMAVIRANVIKPDIILVLGDEAARYFAQRLVDTPRRFVYLGIKGDPAEYRLRPALNVTGVREAVPVREVFALMKELVPSANSAAVLADASLEGDAILAEIAQAGDLPLQVAVTERANTLEEWLEAVRDLQYKADVLCIASYSTVIADPDVRDAVPPAELLKLTAEVNQLPDFAFAREAVRPDGVMAAVFVPVSAQAEMAAKMVVDVLIHKKDIGRVPAMTCTARERIISPERAARFGITLMPPATEEEDAIPETAE